MIVGSLCGVSALLKDWALIILVAIIPCVLYLLVIYKKQQRIILFVGIILILLARSAVQTGGAMLAERKLGVKANNQIIASEMYVSLDPNGNGLWDPERLGEYQQMVQEHDYDFDAANREAMQEIVRRIKENLDKMPSFLLYKGTHAYGDDEELLAWPLDYSMNPDYHQYFIANIYLWKSISKLFYAFVVACLCISAVTLRNRYIFFIELISVGAILSGLLIECQGRYKYSMEGKQPALSPGKQNYDFVYISDVAHAFYLIGEYGVDGTNYFIGSGKIRPLKEYLQKVGELVNQANGTNIELGFGKIQANVVYLPEEAFDVKTLQDHTGFCPMVSFEDGIRRTIRSIQNEMRTEG